MGRKWPSLRNCKTELRPIASKIRTGIVSREENLLDSWRVLGGASVPLNFARLTLVERSLAKWGEGSSGKGTSRDEKAWEEEVAILREFDKLESGKLNC